jgi:putative membrane protein
MIPFMSAQRAITLVVRWLVLAFAVWVAAGVVEGIRWAGWDSILVVAAVLGLLNLYVKPLIKLLTLPLTLITFGLFLLVLNALFLALASWLAGNIKGIDFHVDDFWAALLGAAIISIVSMVVGWFVDADRIARNLTGRI